VKSLWDIGIQIFEVFLEGWGGEFVLSCCLSLSPFHSTPIGIEMGTGGTCPLPTKTVTLLLYVPPTKMV